MKQLFFLCIVLLLFSQVMLAQDFKPPVKMGVGLTANNYLGDFNDPGYFRLYSGVVFSIQKATRKPINLHLRAGFGKFADQVDGAALPSASNTFVETSYIHGELGLTYRLFPAKRFQPLLHLGFGFVNFTPRDVEGRKLIRNNGPLSQGASTNTFIPQVPGGLGFETRLNPYLSLEFLYSYRFIPSDYLDNYAEPSEGAFSFDALQSLGISFMFSLGKGPEMPPKRRKPAKKAEKPLEIIPEG